MIEDVTEPGAETPVVPAGQGKEDNVTITKSELDGLRRELTERTESERYWAGLARSSGRAPAPTVEDDTPDGREFLDEDEPNPELADDTAEKLVNDFASTGVAALSKRGFITKADAHKIAADVAVKVSRELISRERQKMSADEAIIKDFPELKDQDSDLFKETAKRYTKVLKMDPSAMKSPAAFYLAAESAKEFLRGRQPRQDEDRDRGGREREEDRRDRANAQDGRARGRSQVVDDDMLGEEAKSIIKAMGISEKEFLESKKTTAGMRSSRR